MLEDDVFIENTRLVSGSKTQDLNLRADLVLNMSRGPSGQWFPETEYWASAIFVGTSGIPPKIIYRSVKSYKSLMRSNVYWTNMDRDIEDWVKACKSCALAAKAPPIKLSPWPKINRPWSRIHIDFAGPLDCFYNWLRWKMEMRLLMSAQIWLAVLKLCR